MCGFLNGNNGVAKSVVGEITDNSNNAKAFSYFKYHISTKESLNI